MLNMFHAAWLLLTGMADDLKTFVEKDGKALVARQYKILRNQIILTFVSVLLMGAYGLNKAGNAINQAEVDSGVGWIRGASLAFAIMFSLVLVRIGIYAAIFNGTLDALTAVKRICGMSTLKTEASKSMGKTILGIVAWTCAVCAFASVVPVYRSMGYLAITVITGLAMASGAAAYWDKSPLARWILMVSMGVTFLFTTALLFSTDLDRNVKNWNARFLGSDAAQFNREIIATYQTKIDDIRNESIKNPECKLQYCIKEDAKKVENLQAIILLLQTDTEAYWRKVGVVGESKSKAEAKGDEQPKQTVTSQIGEAAQAVGEAAQAAAVATSAHTEAFLESQATKAPAAPQAVPRASNDPAEAARQKKRAEIRAELLAKYPQFAQKQAQ